MDNEEKTTPTPPNETNEASESLEAQVKQSVHTATAAAVEHYPFPSIRGLPGILVGLIGLGGCWLVYKIVGYGVERGMFIQGDKRMWMLLLVAGTVLGSLALTALVVLGLGSRRRERKHLPLWTKPGRRRMLVMTIAWTLALTMAIRALAAGQAGWIAPMFLGFYGLALFAVPTPGRIPTALLAILVSLCAVLSAILPPLGIYLVAVGLGLGPLVFGLITLLDASGSKGDS